MELRVPRQGLPRLPHLPPGNCLLSNPTTTLLSKKATCSHRQTCHDHCERRNRVMGFLTPSRPRTIDDALGHRGGNGAAACLDRSGCCRITTYHHIQEKVHHPNPQYQNLFYSKHYFTSAGREVVDRRPQARRRSHLKGYTHPPRAPPTLIGKSTHTTTGDDHCDLLTFVVGSCTSPTWLLF